MKQPTPAEVKNPAKNQPARPSILDAAVAEHKAVRETKSDLFRKLDEKFAELFKPAK